MTRAFYTSLAGGSFASWVEQALLKQLGASSPTWQQLPAEASFRSFFRIETDKGSFVAMHAPPEMENPRQFVRLAEFFSSQQIPVPELYAQDPGLGFVLMEDLGDEPLEKIYRRGEPNAALDLAIRCLISIQRIEASEAFIPPYNEERLRMELGLFSEWFARGLLGTNMPTWYPALCDGLVENALDQPQCCVHRDFHCRNLLIDMSGDLRVVDFQDALKGPVSYDLCSLLHDCYFSFEEASIARGIHTYRRLAKTQGITMIEDESSFRRSFDLMAIQRQLKAVGIFARLWLRDQRKSHLPDVVPVLKSLARLCARHRQCAALTEQINGNYLPSAISRVEGLL